MYKSQDDYRDSTVTARIFIALGFILSIVNNTPSKMWQWTINDLSLIGVLILDQTVKGEIIGGIYGIPVICIKNNEYK